MRHPSSSEKLGGSDVVTNTPPSPRRRWIKMGPLSGRSRSDENNAPPASASGSNNNGRPASPPLSLAAAEATSTTPTGHVPVIPLDTPPSKKTWEHKFGSFLSKRLSQQQPANANTTSAGEAGFPPVPLMAPLQHKQKSAPSPRSSSSKSKLFRQQQQQQQQSSSSGDQHSDASVRGGKFFSSMFGGGGGTSQKSSRRKTKSLNELDSTMRNGQNKALPASPQHNSHKTAAAVHQHTSSGSSATTLDSHRRVQSQANVSSLSYIVEEDDLSISRRKATYAGTTTGASIVPPPTHQPHRISHPDHLQQQQHRFLQQQYQQQQQQLQFHPQIGGSSSSLNPYPSGQQHLPLSLSREQQPSQQLPYLPLRSSQQQQQQQYEPHQHAQYYPQHHLIPPQQQQQLPSYSQLTGTASLPDSSGPPLIHSRQASASSHSMSPSSASTEIKKAFTEFHNSAKYARDSTSAYLGDEPSTRQGDAYAMYIQPGLVAAPTTYSRNYSSGNINSGSGSGHGHRFLSSSLPTVDENVSIHKSMRMLRPFQTVDHWQPGRRYLIGPAALAACPLLQGISSLSLSSACHTRGAERSDTNSVEVNGQETTAAVKDDAPATRHESEEANTVNSPKNCNRHERNPETLSPTRLPPLFGCIVLGKALLSYVVSEPGYQQQQRWWSSSILILRQNYLLEYDQQTGDVLQGLPRGYAHLQFSKSYAHPDFSDALELEFFVSPCAKADKRVLTIRLEEDREKRDNWIGCLNRAAQLDIHDLYEYEDSGEVGHGRYAGIYQAKRKDEDGQEVALKIIDKKMFWSRVVKGRERGDTLIRETSVQATMTAKCSKIPAFVRLRGFFETSENVVLELELLKGMDLFQYVSSKGVLSEKEAALILRDILSVLDGMNRAGLAHRDIKPANCLMCKTDDSSTDVSSCVVKVADFGMATFAGVDGLVRGRCGTPGYVAPEIYRAGLHGGYGNKVDVFSAGVTAYVMLCGYEPFYGESDADLVAANKEAKVEFPSNDWKQVSPEAKELVKRMMDPNPTQRLSAKEALEHSWIVTHAGSTKSTTVTGHTGLDALNASMHAKYGACVIS